ncbi:MAG: hypothetical protein JRH20_15140 [Deltaproteobacteria bacterium]|nr:hypothetical protein [Deltaproteobacteria bacterium]
MLKFNKLVATVGIAAGLLMVSAPAIACTTFLMSDGTKVMVGKSYDWDIGAGLALTNKRGVEKTALVLSLNDTPAEC